MFTTEEYAEAILQAAASALLEKIFGDSVLPVTPSSKGLIDVLCGSKPAQNYFEKRVATSTDDVMMELLMRQW